MDDDKFYCPHCGKEISKEELNSYFAKIGSHANRKKQDKDFYKRIGALGGKHKKGYKKPASS